MVHLDECVYRVSNSVFCGECHHNLLWITEVVQARTTKCPVNSHFVVVGEYQPFPIISDQNPVV